MTLDSTLGIIGIILTLIIFFYQLRLTQKQDAILREQKELAESLSKLEIREKLGPIQDHLSGLLSCIRNLGSAAVELEGALLLLREDPSFEDQVPVAAELFAARTGLAGVLSGPENLSPSEKQEVRAVTINLQDTSSNLRGDLAQLLKSIEIYQRGDNIPIESQEQCNRCQEQARLIIDNAEKIAIHAFFVLTDSRAMFAAWELADSESKDEVAQLMAEYWFSLDLFPAPPKYKGGVFTDDSLGETVKKELPKLSEVVTIKLAVER
jgi:hypothetical protein